MGNVTTRVTSHHVDNGASGVVGLGAPQDLVNHRGGLALAPQ